VWRTDRAEDQCIADVTGWWHDPAILAGLGPAMAELFESDKPTVVVGLQSRGCLLGSLVAVSLGVGLVEIRKEPSPAADSDPWLTRTTPPDYEDRHLTLGFRRHLVRSGDRVVLVDDWIATGGQALTAQQLVSDAGGQWLGAAVVVDALIDNRVRRQLRLRSLMNEREL
jgi:adenine phosphoribosyltransferase